MKTRVSLKYFVNDCLWKHFFDSNSPQTLVNVISLPILATLRPSSLCQAKIRDIKLPKSVKVLLTL